ncbi:MAG: DUF4129 domain-containing protein [Chloroflexi bacterium]|nr:DUF4129 domain-containing protein [Chloroflexota bacterium]
MSTLAPPRPSEAPSPVEMAPRLAPRPRARFNPLVFLALLTPPEGWLAIIGFAAAAEGLAVSISRAGWQPGLTGLPWLAGLAVALSYLFSRGGRSSWIYWPLGLVIGPMAAVRLPAAAFLPVNMGWRDQMVTLTARLVDWINHGLQGRIIQDDVLISFAIAVFLFLWIYVCYLPAVRVRLAWIGSGLLAAPLFANVLFKPSTGGRWLALWAAGSLLMILAASVRRRERFYARLGFFSWRQGSRLSLAGGVAMAGVTTLAFSMAPGVPFSQALNDLYQKLNGPIGNARSAYDQMGVPRQVDLAEVRQDSFTPLLKFLGPFRPGTELVMKVRTDKSRYQQGIVFDEYSHIGWTNSRFDRFDQNNSSEFNTFTALTQTAKDKDREQVAEDVIQVKPVGALLFAPPQPLGASVQLKGDGWGDLRATSVVQPNQLYNSAALESTAAAESLAAASGAAPTDLRLAFTQLPPDMPSRLRDLAVQVTAGKTSAFDKAVALESYVRTLPFDTEIPAPPEGRDGVDWYLFDMRRGYSDYDSSAMAVLLRELNIPARVVSGYAPGQLNEDGWYYITQKDAHTWTQAYFPGYGWIDFEPSPDLPPFPRRSLTQENQPGGAEPTVQPSASPTPANGGQAIPTPIGGGGSSQPNNPPVKFPWWLLVLAAAGGGAIWYIRRILQGSPGASLAYMRVALAGTLLGLRPHSWQTPQEYGRQLQARRRFHAGSTETITSLYSAHRYSAAGLDTEANVRAWLAWQQLKRRLLPFGKRRS